MVFSRGRGAERQLRDVVILSAEAAAAPSSAQLFSDLFFTVVVSRLQSLVAGLEIQNEIFQK